ASASCGHDRGRGRSLVQTVRAPSIRAQEGEQPADPLVGVDLLDQLYVIFAELQLLGERSLDDVQGHARRILTRPPSVGKGVAVGVRGGLGAVGAAGLLEDAADVIGDRVLADVQRGADLTVAACARDLAQDLY